MYIIIDILKALACIFIFLYHCNTILPGEWRFITILGMDVGNCLFFTVSGFALYRSIRNTEVSAFLSWYKKRLIRILPLLALAYLTAYIYGFYSLTDLNQLVAVFVFPTLYWFCSAILLFYILLFFAGKLLPERVIPFLILPLFAAAVIRGTSIDSYYLTGFGNMLAGYWLCSLTRAKEPADIQDPTQTKAPADMQYPTMTKASSDVKGARHPACLLTIAGMLALIVYIVIRLRFEDIMPTTILRTCTIVLPMLFTALTLMAGIMDEPRLTSFFANKNALRSFIATLGRMALPLYMVQCWCGGFIGFYILQHVKFPLSFLVNFIAVWTLTTILYFINQRITASN